MTCFINKKLAYKYIAKKSVSEWTQGFLTDLKLAYQPVDMSYFLGFNFQDDKKIDRVINARAWRRYGCYGCNGTTVSAARLPD